MWRLCLRMMLIAVICVSALPENALAESKLITKRDTAHRYCGRNLVNILRLLCRGQYNGMEAERKREADYYNDRKSTKVSDREDYLWSEPEDLDYFPELHYPFRARSGANQLANRGFRRQKRSDGGIVDECCILKGCTVNELTSYCLSR